MTPAELMKAILQAPVDLLWNGGIGTYVKARGRDPRRRRRQGQRRDPGQRPRAARPVRRRGRQPRPHPARPDRVRPHGDEGGRINTDFIDNSAGVDTSDHEVNIKILLDRVVKDGDLTEKQRNALLAEMTDEVAALVLRDNYEQNLALANAVAHAPSLLHVHEDFMRRLEQARHPRPRDRGAAVHAARYAGGSTAATGSPPPELSVLLAWTKIVLADELLGSRPARRPVPRPRPARRTSRRRCARGSRDQIEAHPLRREIIVTQVVNDLVNGAGMTFWPRLAGRDRRHRGRPAPGPTSWPARSSGRCRCATSSTSYDNQLDAAVQTRMRIEMRTLVERASRWLVNNRRPPLDSQATVDRSPDRCRRRWRSCPS